MFLKHSVFASVCLACSLFIVWFQGHLPAVKSKIKADSSESNILFLQFLGIIYSFLISSYFVF